MNKEAVNVNPKIKRTLQKNQSQFKISNSAKMSRVEEKQLELLSNMEKEMEKEKGGSSENAFCNSLAEDLKTFSQVEQIMIKKEINDIIYKYQFSKFTKQQIQPFAMNNIGTNISNFATSSNNFLPTKRNDPSNNIENMNNSYYIKTQSNSSTTSIGSPEYFHGGVNFSTPNLHK